MEINASGKPAFEAALQRLQAGMQHAHRTSQHVADAGMRQPAPPHVEYIVSSAGAQAQQFLTGIDVAIVDPPRKGLDAELLSVLCKSAERRQGAASMKGRTPSGMMHAAHVVHSSANAASKFDRARVGPGKRSQHAGPLDQSQSGALPQVLIYLSCGFSALVRDSNALLKSGRWRLAHAEAFGFFPGTDSVETLAVFHSQDWRP